MKDKDLDQALKKWGLDFPEDPHFRSSVWREIAMRDAASPANRFREALDRFLTPQLAVPAAALAIVAVMLTAVFHGERSRQQAWNNLATAYSSAIDPIVHTDVIASITASQP